MAINRQNEMFSLAAILQKEFQNTFETELNKKIDVLQQEMQLKLHQYINEARQDAKIKAQKMAVELFAKSNVAGISLEFKI